MTRQRHNPHRIKIDWWAQFWDPNYSIIKTTVTNLLDDAATSPHRSVRQLGQWIGHRTPTDWNNWFS